MVNEILRGSGGSDGMGVNRGELARTGNFEVMRLNPLDSEYADWINKVAEAYQDVFGGPPWNEYVRDEKTGRTFGNTPEERRRAEMLGLKWDELEIIYSKDSVVSGIIEDWRSGESPFLIVSAHDTGNGLKEVGGFLWGTAMELDRVGSRIVRSGSLGDDFKRAGLLGEQVTGIGERIVGAVRRVAKDELRVDELGYVTYVSEIGVRQQYRGDGRVFLGLLNELVRPQIEDGYPIYAFWTSPKSSIFGIIERFGGMVAYRFSDDVSDSDRVVIVGDGRALLGRLELANQRGMRALFFGREESARVQ